MKSIIHRSETRGHANHGWLDTHHTFSFADYHNPERVHFGALRVLNDDIVAPGMGFATHGHQDMEIISIALEGELEHQDSMGNVHVIKKDDVQVMSAGTGIRHSEKNRSQSQHTNFLQIWVFPREHGVKPRYQQMNFPRESKKNHLLNVIGPDQSGSTLWIHQHAWLYLGQVDGGQKLRHQLNNTSNGIYLFVISGSVQIDQTILNQRDGLALWDFDSINLEFLQDTEILAIEVPLN